MATFMVQTVTYNNAATIEMALQSVLAQQGIDYELVVIDNASHDNTVETVKKLGVRVIENPQNTGYTGGHNVGLRQSSSPYVLTLNPDACLQPNFLRAAFETLEANPKVGSLSGLLLSVPELGAEPGAIDSTGVVMSKTHRQRLRDNTASLDKIPTTSSPIFGPDGAAAVYRRAMLDVIAFEGEFFDEDFFMHKEDIDICWRAQWAGWQSLFVPQMVVHHVRHFRPGHRENISAYMRFLAVRNRYLLMAKNEAIPIFLRNLPYIAAYDVGIAGYTCLREWSSLKAFPSALKLMPRMLQKRRFIQHTRQVEWQTLQQWFQY